MSDKKYTFGQPSLMKAIEPGQKASIKFLDHPKVVETEWGMKYSFPIILLSHPSYDSIPKSGMNMKWQSKSESAKGLFFWMYNEINDDDEYIMKVFDVDMSKELDSKMVLHRHDSGQYLLEITG